MTPAEECRAAADKLRPSSPAVAAHTVWVKIRPEAADALADWLDAAAAVPPGWQDTVSCYALAVARQILGSPS